VIYTFVRVASGYYLISPMPQPAAGRYMIAVGGVLRYYDLTPVEGFWQVMPVGDETPALPDGTYQVQMAEGQP